MFKNHMFDSDHLGSDEEKKLLQYTGWTILAHIKAQNYAQAIQWVRHTFSSDGTEFNEQENRYFIGSNFDDRAIEVFPAKIKYKDSHSKKAETYNLIFEANFFGFKQYQELKHQDLCLKILSKIRRKKGFFVKENKLFPI